MKVLIIGSTGFIGRRVVKFCVEEGWDVTAGARDIKKAQKIFNELPVEIAEIDLSTWNFELRNYDAVLNLAALLPKKSREVEKMFSVNSLGVYRLLRKCRKSGVQRVVHSSSMAVFGKPEYLPVDEKHPKNPVKYYGMSKLSGELILKNEEWAGIERILLRYSSVYGPEMNENEVVSIFIRKMLNGEEVRVAANTTADFVFVDDIARANVLAVKFEMENEFEDFNIGSGEEISIEELAKVVRKVTNSKGEILISDGKRRRFYFDISKARGMLGYEPRINLENGIEMCLNTLKGGENEI